MASTQGLFGGGGSGEEQKKKAQDFINRYQTGNPTEGYSDEEAVQHFRQAAQVATPAQMQSAFHQAVAGLPENDRAQFNQMLQERKAGKGMVDIQRSGERRATTERGSGGGDNTVGLDDLLGGLLGGAAGGGAASGGGGLGDILGGLLGGPSDSNTGSTAPAPRQGDPGGGLGDMLGDILKSPIGKAVLAGTAAYAMKEVLGGK